MVLFLYIVLMKTRREITTMRLKIVSSLSSRKQRRRASMRLVEDNARAHIHFDVINYLTDERMNTHSPDRCTV